MSLLYNTCQNPFFPKVVDRGDDATVAHTLLLATERQVGFSIHKNLSSALLMRREGHKMSLLSDSKPLT